MSWDDVKSNQSHMFLDRRRAFTVDDIVTNLVKKINSKA